MLLFRLERVKSISIFGIFFPNILKFLVEGFHSYVNDFSLFHISELLNENCFLDCLEEMGLNLYFQLKELKLSFLFVGCSHRNLFSGTFESHYQSRSSNIFQNELIFSELNLECNIDDLDIDFLVINGVDCDFVIIQLESFLFTLDCHFNLVNLDLLWTLQRLSFELIIL